MKRAWIGVGLLAVLLVLSLLAGHVMQTRLCPGAQVLRQAGEAARDGDWAMAISLTEGVRLEWERLQWVMELLSSHTVIEEIGTGFAQLEPYAAARDAVGYSALCAALAEALQAQGQAHGCSLGNFF